MATFRGVRRAARQVQVAGQRRQHLGVAVHPVAAQRLAGHVDDLDALFHGHFAAQAVVVRPGDVGHGHGRQQHTAGGGMLGDAAERDADRRLARLRHVDRVQGGVRDAVVSGNAGQRGQPVVVALHELGLHVRAVGALDQRDGVPQGVGGQVHAHHEGVGDALGEVPAGRRGAQSAGGGATQDHPHLQAGAAGARRRRSGPASPGSVGRTASGRSPPVDVPSAPPRAGPFRRSASRTGSCRPR